MAGRGRKDGQAVGRMGDDRGTHRVGSVRGARSTPTTTMTIERQRSRIYAVRWVSVSVVLKFSVLKLKRIGFQLRNPVVYWKCTGSCRGQAESGARPPPAGRPEWRASDFSSESPGRGPSRAASGRGKPAVRGVALPSQGSPIREGSGPSRQR